MSALFVLASGCNSSSPETGAETDGGSTPDDATTDTGILSDAAAKGGDEGDGGPGTISDATGAGGDAGDGGPGTTSDATGTDMDAGDGGPGTSFDATGTDMDASDESDADTNSDTGAGDAATSSDTGAGSDTGTESGTNQWTISGLTNSLLGTLTLNDNGDCLGAGCADFPVTPSPLGGINIAFTGWAVPNGANYFISIVAPLPADCGGGTNGGGDVCWNGAGQANQSCTIVQQAGGPVDANVTSASGPRVTCLTNVFGVSGTVLNLATGNTITVQGDSAANQVTISGAGAATANFTLSRPISSGAGPFPGGGYVLTFAGTGGTVQSIGPIAADPDAGFQVNGAVPQICTITAPALPYVENVSVTPANGPVITCVNS